MMTERLTYPLMMRHGVFGALCGALVALVLVVLLYGGFIVVRGWIAGTSAFTRNDNL